MKIQKCFLTRNKFISNVVVINDDGSTEVFNAFIVHWEVSYSNFVFQYKDGNYYSFTAFPLIFSDRVDYTIPCLADNDMIKEAEKIQKQA